MKKFLFLTLLFLVFISSNKVKADCEDTEIIRLQNLARNVMTSYVYNENEGRFTITINNLKKDLVVRNMDNSREYSSDSELNFGNLFSGKHTYIIYARNKSCTSYELTTIYVYLPYYNSFFNSMECKGIENYSYCNKWVKNPISEKIWEQKVKDHKKTIEKKEQKSKKVEVTSLAQLFKKGKELYMKYYYIIL